MLRLTRGESEGDGLVEQLLDVIIKELDQSVGTAAGTSHWFVLYVFCFSLFQIPKFSC
jgi:hypothetical protein